MPASHKRKKVLLPKHQKPRVKKRTLYKKRKLHTPYVETLVSAGHYKILPGVKTQAYDLKNERQRTKRKYVTEPLNKNKFPKKYWRLYDYVKRYKNKISQMYTWEMEIEMRKRGYFPHEIRWAKKYSIVGRGVQSAIARVEGRVTKHTTAKQKNSMIKRAVKRARINSYMDVLGISKKKAQEIYNIFVKHLPGEFVLKGLIY